MGDASTSSLLGALRPSLEADTGLSSSGFPYLSQAGFAEFKRRVPHVLGMGDRILTALDQARMKSGVVTGIDSTVFIEGTQPDNPDS